MRAHTTEAIDLMRRFAERTGVSTGGDRRYLWTDAFAVCNFLGLASLTGDALFTALARRLVDRVHEVLGHHRPDARRRGWLDAASASQPTRGGLRIGKRLPERAPTDPVDEQLEWDRDGQYFHYLTKWAHALDRMARSVGSERYHMWASELVEAAHRGFLHRSAAGDLRMYWKMSTDLTRPLVLSMGQHDPLDGWLTCVQLSAGSRQRPTVADTPELGGATADFRAMLHAGNLATSDPLGIGGLLADACRLAQLLERGAPPYGRQLLEELLLAALQGLATYAREAEWRRSVTHRLAFRELGLVIGLDAVAWLLRGAAPQSRSPAVRSLLDSLVPYTSLRDEILTCWRQPEHGQHALAVGGLHDASMSFSSMPGRSAMTRISPAFSFTSTCGKRSRDGHAFRGRSKKCSSRSFISLCNARKGSRARPTSLLLPFHGIMSRRLIVVPPFIRLREQASCRMSPALEATRAGRGRSVCLLTMGIGGRLDSRDRSVDGPSRRRCRTLGGMRGSC